MSTNSEFKISRLTKDDYDNGIIELLSQLTISDKTKISKHDFDRYVTDLSTNDNHFTIVVTENGSNKVIGTGTLLVEPKLIRNISKVGHIEDLVVDSQYRGKNLGKLIIEHLVNKSEKLGCYKVILDCDEKNVPFYTKCNFQEKGVQMGIYFK